MFISNTAFPRKKINIVQWVYYPPLSFSQPQGTLGATCWDSDLTSRRNPNHIVTLMGKSCPEDLPSNHLMLYKQEINHCCEHKEGVAMLDAGMIHPSSQSGRQSMWAQKQSHRSRVVGRLSEGGSRGIFWLLLFWSWNKRQIIENGEGNGSVKTKKRVLKQSSQREGGSEWLEKC